MRFLADRKCHMLIFLYQKTNVGQEDFLKFEIVFYCHKSPHGTQEYSCSTVLDVYMTYWYI